jgi:hypothetical protein
MAWLEKERKKELVAVWLGEMLKGFVLQSVINGLDKMDGLLCSPLSLYQDWLQAIAFVCVACHFHTFIIHSFLL